jgi:hypothetical protein
MIWYYNSSSTSSANALDGLLGHSIVLIHQIHVAGVASGSATMVAVFATVCCVMWLFS